VPWNSKKLLFQGSTSGEEIDEVGKLGNFLMDFYKQIRSSKLGEFVCKIKNRLISEAVRCIQIYLVE
jgi:hypothetical protein